MASRRKKTPEQQEAERAKLLASAQRKAELEAEDARWEGPLVEIVRLYTDDEGRNMMHIEVTPVVRMPECQDGCGK